jgi:hypothetical protein
MTTAAPDTHAMLVAELRRITAIVERRGDGARPAVPARTPPDPDAPLAPIDVLRQVFELSPFEVDVLLLCAGVELDAACAQAVAHRQDRGPPDFALALAVLPDAHWSALLPDSALRRWRLLDVAAGPSLTGAALRIDERILHYLVGLDLLDPRLTGLVVEVEPGAELAPSHQAIARQIDDCWQAAFERGQRLPTIQLCGRDHVLNREIAACVSQALGCRLLVVDQHDLPDMVDDHDRLMRLIERETLLCPSCVLVIGSGSDRPGAALREANLARLIERTTMPLLVSVPAPLPPGSRATLCVTVDRISAAEQRAMWRKVVGPDRMAAADLDTIAYQFDLSLGAMRAAALEAINLANGNPDLPFAQALWQACCHAARAAMTGLVTRIETHHGWDHLILPEPEKDQLHALVAQIRQRPKVFGEWQFADAGGRGLGVAALFAGTSGTGKTLAAEVLAHELGLDLYRIDLSAVVDKYIGETEKNLARVFDAAEAGGAILLFDEADALFGKRSEVRDSHDRHANIEVGYLLQRVESYRGMAILTTNLKDSIDPAFLRRLRCIVTFPFPDAVQREAIWRTMFPAGVPLDGIDFAQLGRLNVAGGTIRNIALNAAFLAASDTGALTMRHIRAAAQTEYTKLNRTLSEAEMKVWP